MAIDYVSANKYQGYVLSITSVNIYIYIYIEREREREREMHMNHLSWHIGRKNNFLYILLLASEMPICENGPDSRALRFHKGISRVLDVDNIYMCIYIYIYMYSIL